MRRPLFGREDARVLSRTIPGLCVALGLALIGSAAHTRSAQSQTVSALSHLPSITQPVAVRNMAARPTIGWVRFCEQNPEECAVDLSEPAMIELAPKVWQTLVRINRQVNGSIKAAADKDHWGVQDRWDFAEDGYGDCEDYQLVKRRLLVEAGFPHRALRMTVVIDEDGDGHAVMMVRTDRGDYILDNRRNSVLPWHQTGYTYVKREADGGSAWASLGGVGSPIATAGR
jgi:predicted transglutaminase-like cysteine proteinase